VWAPCVTVLDAVFGRGTEILKRHGFLLFILVWVVASVVTGAFVGATDPCHYNALFCGVGVMATVVGAGFVVAAVVTLIVVSGRDGSTGWGLGRAHGWTLGAAIAVWLTILTAFAVPGILERNEQRRADAAHGDAQQAAEIEYEAAVLAWWVERVELIVGIDLRSVARSGPQTRFAPFWEMCVEVEHELIASTMDGSRSITAVWVGDLPSYQVGDLARCVSANALPLSVLREFIATRGELGLQTTRREKRGRLLVFTTGPATGTPVATEGQIEAVADLMVAAQSVHVFDAVVLCDAPDAAVVVRQDNGQPPYQDCPPVSGPLYGPTIDLSDTEPPVVLDVDPPQITISTPGSQIVAAYSPFRFNGLTEPDAAVYVDGLEAAVALDGRWEVWLPLTDGSQIVVFEAVDAADNTTETSREVVFDPSLLTLRRDGIGAVSFGEEASVATNRLTELLGPPSRVEEEAATDSNALPFGIWARTLVRVVSWDEVGLTAVFSDGGQFRTDGMLHLVAWSVGGDARVSLVTPSGVSVESSLGELMTKHPDELWIASDFDECTGEWPIRIGHLDTSNVITLIYDIDPSVEEARPVSLSAGVLSTC
jgi:hypothetical protein